MKTSVGKLIKERGFLEGVKTQEDLSKLLKELHSDLLEAMLHGELEAHLAILKVKKMSIQIPVTDSFISD